MIKKLFILSTKAGNGNFADFKNKIIDTYTKHNRLDELEIVLTEDKEHGKKAALEFSKRNYSNKIVIACGGDGTIGEIAGVLAKSDTALGLIPMGTGNDFSKNFDYSNFQIEDTFEPEIRPIDIIDINGEKCINVMSIGFDTHILKRTYDFLNLYPKLGKKAFILAIIQSLLNIKNEKLEYDLITVTGKNLKVSGEYIISALCNGGYYGSGFNPSPTALIGDGVLNLVAIKKLPYLSIIPLIFKYKKGTHITHENVEEYEVVSGKIKTPQGAIANMDGEIFQFKEIDFKVIKNGILWAYLAK